MKKNLLTIVYALIGGLAMISLIVIGKVNLEPHTMWEGVQEAWPAGAIIALGTLGSVIALQKGAPAAVLIQGVALMLSPVAFALTDYIVAPGGGAWGLVISLAISFPVALLSVGLILIATTLYERHFGETAF